MTKALRTVWLLLVALAILAVPAQAATGVSGGRVAVAMASVAQSGVVASPASPLPPGGTRTQPDNLKRQGDPTPTPNPATVPVSGWKYNFPQRDGTKLGIHFLRGSQEGFEYMRRVHPPVAKAVDAVGLGDAMKEELPDMVTVGRMNGQDESLRNIDPRQAADMYIDQWLPTYRLNRNIDYWEGWNEYQPQTTADWNWYAAFEARRACRMRGLRLHAAVGGFSVGRPEYNEMLLFLPAIRAAAVCRGILTLHEYSAPVLQYGFGAPLPDRPTYPDRGILLFRYRTWYEDIFKPLDLAVPLVVTEAGIDGGVGAGRPGPNGSGWRTFEEWWQTSGLTTDSRAFYVSQLLWYDQELRKDDYLIGVTLYTAGAYSDTPWDTFSLETILPQLADALAACCAP